MTQKTIKYQLISASGNPTAIIYGQYPPSIQSKIIQKIFSTNKLVEQIGFIYKQNQFYKFQMMGNEFSGNGCRAAGFSLLKLKPGTVKFKTSGTNKIIKTQVDSKNNTTTTIPYETSKKYKKNKQFFIKIFGSRIVVIKNKPDNKTTQKILKTYSPSCNAIGIMFLQENKGGYKLTPYFYVKKTKTLVKETACGSGSAACAVYLSSKFKQENNQFQILQPSNQNINVETKKSKNKIKIINISGPTKLLKKYNVKIQL